MFETHFSFLSTMFIKDVTKFDSFLLIKNKTSMIRREIIKTIYKINLNKIFEINKIINKVLQQLIRVVIK